MTASPPDVRVYITPPRGKRTDYSQYLSYSGASVSTSFTQNFGRQGDTGTVALVDSNYSTERITTSQARKITVTPSFHIPAFSLIEVIDHAVAKLPNSDQFNHGILFAGYVNNPILKILSPNEAEWNLNVVDYSGYANASVVYGEYEGLKMEDLIVDLVAFADCGIYASTTANGGFVSPGPVLPRMVFPHTNLTAALQRISKMASSVSAYGWYVDQNFQLHFYDQNQALLSGVTVTDAPTTAGALSTTECHFALDGSFKYEYDGTSLYNRAVVTGATTTISPHAVQSVRGTGLSKKGKVVAKTYKTLTTPTDTWYSTGTQASFPLSFVPDVRATTPTLFVGSTLTPISYNDGTSTPTTPWMIVQSPSASWTLQVNFAAGGSVPSVGTPIAIWYPYQVQITAQADNVVSQRAIGGPNGGVFATAINQRSITTTSGAYQRATREITEYGHPQERITFTTTPEFVGVWRAGQTFVLKSQLLLDSQNHFTAPLNATFVITQATLTFTDQGYRKWQITAVRVA